MKIDRALRRRTTYLQQLADPSAGEYCRLPHEVKGPITLGYRRNTKLAKDKALEKVKKVET